MYCKRCGSENEDNAVYCASCGEVMVTQTAGTNPGTGQQFHNAGVPNIPNYMVQSILLLVFSVICCFTCVGIIAIPFSIIALVNSNQVNTKVRMGDYAGAQEASRKAKTWCWVSFGIILAAIILTVIYYVYIIVSGVNAGLYEEFLNELYKY